MRSRILVGLLITLVIFVVARRMSRNRPRFLEMEAAGSVVTHESVYEQVGPGQPVITLRSDPDAGIEPRLVYTVDRSGPERTIVMREGPEGVWTAGLPSMEKGHRIDYSFRIYPAATGARGTPEAESGSFRLKYKGEVSTTILVLHILCMFGAFFFIVESLLGSGAMLIRDEGREFTVGMTRWAILFVFLGGFPLGFALNWQRFGVMWEAFPFGWDVTDNKTQVIFILWLITALVSWRSFFGRRTGRDPVGNRAYAAIVAAVSIISIILYLVPHSL